MISRTISQMEIFFLINIYIYMIFLVHMIELKDWRKLVRNQRAISLASKPRRREGGGSVRSEDTGSDFEAIWLWYFVFGIPLKGLSTGQRSVVAVNYTACLTRLRASGPLVINERSNLPPPEIRANTLSLVKLGSKASPD